MSFAAEIKGFINGYKAGSEMWDAAENRRLTRAQSLYRENEAWKNRRPDEGEVESMPGVGGTGTGVPVRGDTTYIPHSDERREKWRQGISSIESGSAKGNYGAVGSVVNRSGDRALGRYQIMASNVGPWSKQVLGHEVTTEEFLASPKIQDALFDNIFGGYVEKYGEKGAAEAWFGGPGAVGKGDRKDMHGTTVAGYGSQFVDFLGGEQPVQTAQKPGGVIPDPNKPDIANTVPEELQTEGDKKKNTQTAEETKPSDKIEVPTLDQVAPTVPVAEAAPAAAPVEDVDDGGWVDEEDYSATGDETAWLTDPNRQAIVAGGASPIFDAWARPVVAAASGGVLPDPVQNFADGGAPLPPGYAPRPNPDPYNAARAYTQPLPAQAASSFVPRRVSAPVIPASGAGAPGGYQQRFRDARAKRAAEIAARPVAAPAAPAAPAARPYDPKARKYDFNLQRMVNPTDPTGRRPVFGIGGRDGGGWGEHAAAGGAGRSGGATAGGKGLWAEGGIIPETANFAEGGSTSNLSPLQKMLDFFVNNVVDEDSPVGRPIKEAWDAGAEGRGREQQGPAMPNYGVAKPGSPMAREIERRRAAANTAKRQQGPVVAPPRTVATQTSTGQQPFPPAPAPQQPQPAPPGLEPTPGGALDPGATGVPATPDVVRPQQGPQMLKPMQGPPMAPGKPGVLSDEYNIPGSHGVLPEPAAKPGVLSDEYNIPGKTMETAKPGVLSDEYNIPGREQPTGSVTKSRDVPIPAKKPKRERVRIKQKAKPEAKKPEAKKPAPKKKVEERDPFADNWGGAAGSSHAAGGMVMGPTNFAAGGMVDDEVTGSIPPDEGVLPTRPQAAPQDTMVAGPEETDFPERPDPVAAGPATRSAVAIALDGGLNFLKNRFTGAGDDGAIPTPEGQQVAQNGAQRLASGEGAATPDEVRMIDDKIDPDRQLSEGDRHMQRLSKTMQWYLMNGRKEEAEAVAAGLMQYGAQRFGQLGSMAGAAYEKYTQTHDPKDLQGTVKFLDRAFDMVPDGNSLDIEIDPDTHKIMTTRINAEGKSQRVEIEPSELPGLVQGAMDRSLYWDQIAQLSNPQGHIAEMQQEGQNQRTRYTQNEQGKRTMANIRARKEEGGLNREEKVKDRQSREKIAADRIANQGALQDKRMDAAMARLERRLGQPVKIDKADLLGAEENLKILQTKGIDDEAKAAAQAAYDQHVSKIYDNLPPEKAVDALDELGFVRAASEDGGLGWHYVGAGDAPAAVAPQGPAPAGPGAPTPATSTLPKSPVSEAPPAKYPDAKRGKNPKTGEMIWFIIKDGQKYQVK